jgi:hypothetical protein
MGASPTSRSRLVLAIHRLMLATARNPLRRIWACAYQLTARAVTGYLTWGRASTSAYVRGGLAAGDFLPGVSDVDTAIVVGEDPADEGAADRARRRRQRLFRLLPAAELLVEGPMVYDAGALRELVGTSALTFGLDDHANRGGPSAGYFGRHATFDWLRTLERPGLYATTADWRLLRGPDRRPRAPARDSQSRRIAAWLELVYWWRWVFPACIDPAGPRTAALCLKLIAEPMRIWLWLTHGEATSTRLDALRAAIRRLDSRELRENGRELVDRRGGVVA